MCHGGKKTVCGFPFQCFIVWLAITWPQLSRTWVTRSMQRCWSSPPCRELGHWGRSNLSLNRLRSLSMEFRKVGQESCSGLCVWYFISTPVAVPPAHPCGSGSGHFLTPAGMAGWVTPLPLSPLWLLHREHRRFWTFRKSRQSLLQWSNLPSLPF